MRIGLDLLFLDPGRSGGRETYVRELLRAFAKGHPDVEVVAFLNRRVRPADIAGWHPGMELVALPVSARNRAAWAAGVNVLLPRAAGRAGVELLHSPANFAPVAGGGVRVLTLHDLLYRRHPDLIPRLSRLATGPLLERGARRATRVVTVSAASAREIVGELGIAHERVDVVPNGVVPPPAATPDREAERDRLGAGARPVALAVASHLPHKNLAALVDAVATLPDGQRPLTVLAGAGTERLTEGVDVRGLGAVSQDRLEGLYAAADVLVTTTRYEGFGLPVAEAMARGVPVVCSDLPVLREVAGDCAVFVDPGDPGAVGEAIAALLADDARAAALREGGRERAREFTWERAAEGTLAAYRRALGP